MNRRHLNDGVVALVVGQGIAAKLARAPATEDLSLDADGLLERGYVIVHALPGTQFRATQDDAQSIRLLQYQFTSVGRHDTMAQWTADTVRAAMLSRNPGGGFTNPINAGDSRVIDRRLFEEGGPEPSEGGLWQVIDTLDLEVEAVA